MGEQAFVNGTVAYSMAVALIREEIEVFMVIERCRENVWEFLY